MSLSISEHQTSHIFFTSAAVDDDTFKVIRFSGQESISTPYAFNIDLASDEPGIDIDRVINMPARLSIEKDGQQRNIHGVLQVFEQADEALAGHYYYQAVLVPRLWLMTLSRQNQIYQNKTVPEIIQAELLSSQNKGAAVGISADDFEFRLTQTYVRHEYIVQYAESDFNFISRLMEHEGLFYYFEQVDGKEKLVITDNNIHLRVIAEDPAVTYRPASGMSSSDENSVRDFACKRQRIPGRVILKDYNYRMPHLPLQAEKAVDPASHGLVCDYGDHFKIPEEGQSLASIRAQEILARQTVYHGHSDCIHFQPAGKFTLEDHFRTSFNQDYILTSVYHEGHQMLSGIADQAPDHIAGNDYRNRFQAIAANVAFRPARVTPKPKLYGIMNAHVDSSLLEDRAEIDDQGRYKVIMPFDISGQADGKATRYIRMAQPYGGQDQGMHFPLRKNTEVIWTCIDGDPDRPIIIGTVPNPLTPSLVNSGNHTRNIIKTSHGSFLEFNDGRGAAASGNGSGASGTTLGRQQNHQALAYAPPSQQDVALENSTIFPSLASEKKTGELRRQQQLQPTNDTYGESSSDNGHDVWFRVNVPEYKEDKDSDGKVISTESSYLRMGKSPDDEEQYALLKKRLDELKKEDKTPDGWMDYTDGDHASVTMGDRYLITNGNRDEIVNGTYNMSILKGGMDVYDTQPFYNVYWDNMGGTWRKRELQYLNEMNFTTGTSYNMFIGSKIEANVAAALDINVGIKADIGAALQYENVLGPMIHTAVDVESKAMRHVLLRVDPEEKGWLGLAAAKGFDVAKIAAIFGTVIGTGAIATNAANNAFAKKKNEEDGRLSTSLQAGGTAVGAAVVLYAMFALSRKLKERLLNKHNHSTMIKMDKKVIEIDNEPSEQKDERIELKCGDSKIILHADGTIKITGKKVLINGEERAWLEGKTTGLTSSQQGGKTIIGGSRVSISSSTNTTVGSTGTTSVEANASTSVGMPDTQSAVLKAEAARTRQLLKVPPRTPGPSRKDNRPS